MENQEIVRILQINVSDEKLKSISSESLKEIYNRLYDDYMAEYNALGEKPNNMNDYFSWMNKDLNIHLVYYKNRNEVSTIFFLSKSKNAGEIIVHNLINENLSYELLNSEVKIFVSLLIDKNKIKIDPNDILDVSFFSAGHVVYQIGSVFFNREYNNNFLPQLDYSFKSLDFNKLRIHKNIYDFDSIIKTINNKQFTMELKECLIAYQEEKFFVAAAGLGSVLEHLLYLTIEKNVPEKEINTHENSTASEYISQLKKPPFNLTKRDVTNIKGTFAFRNSVSHFNKGYFSKDMCDQLLSGIKICFDRYYMFVRE